MIARPALAHDPTVEPYLDAFEHLQDELGKLDLLLALRAIEASPDETRAAIDQAIAAIEVAQDAIDRRVESSLHVARIPPLPWLGQMLGLSPFEQQSILVCLAPELDLRYTRAYGEIHRNGRLASPTVGLILGLLCRSPAERWRARGALEEGSRLLRWRLLERTASDAGSGLADPIRIDPGVLLFLCGTGGPDPRLAEVATLERMTDATRAEGDRLPPPWDDLARMIRAHARAPARERRPLVAHLTSSVPGRGVVQDLRRVCQDLRHPLLRLDAVALDGREPALDLLRLALRDSCLWQAPLLLEGLGDLSADRATSLITRTLRVAERYGWLVLLDGGPLVPAGQRGVGISWRRFDVPASDHAARARRWRDVLVTTAGDDAAAWASELAGRFRFEPDQIDAAVDLIDLEALGRTAAVSLADCFRACRAQAAPRLGEIGRIFTPRYRWDDLVLPPQKRAQLEAICHGVRHHDAVFGRWGFDRIVHHGRGMSALLSGPSGTGKTMAVEVLGTELGLDVCKVDLSGVVSKYIGETEQRLATAFREAWAANAILFFDEADALFGKRTEITDARDRYANIETSYLLQKIEEYEGIVVLASNLRDNMDEAFLRRLRFVIEFPYPDEAARLDLWRRHLPASAPLDGDVDLPLLARRLAISGGNIRNIALRGALLAAQDGSAIKMPHLVTAGMEEFEKIGKSWVAP